MKAIGIILAGGNKREMGELTRKRAAAAMPMCGSYRAIDFELTSMSHSHIQKVAVLTQYNTRSLNEHLNSSKWWDFGRKQGGLFVYNPTITPNNSSWYRGTIDSIYQNIHFLKNSHEPYVVIASGDGICKLDYNKILDYHINKRADITVVCAKARDWEDANRFGQVETDEEGRILNLEEKPLVESTREVSCGIYIIRRRLLIDLVEECIAADRYDFVRDILIRQRTVKRIFAYHTDTYWSSISSVRSYYMTNMDFLNADVRSFFFIEGDGVQTKANDFPPAKLNPGCRVKGSLISSGTIVNGAVENSVIFKKSYIGSGCVIRNSIILNDVYIGDNTVIENCIVESHTTILANQNYAGTEDNVKLVIEDHDRHVI